MMSAFVIGLDIGTGGARALAVDLKGQILAAANHPIPAPFMDKQGCSEQVAEDWWSGAEKALHGCLDLLHSQGIDLTGLLGICVDATSGSVVFLDKGNQPLYPGLMHNDTRASQQANELNHTLADHCKEVGYAFGATFALPKILWLKEHHPEIFGKTHRIAHQADFIIGRLTGEYGISDPSNSLKTGYNLVHSEWPEELAGLGVLDHLPQVVPSGEIIATVRDDLARSLGISPATPVLAGVTDSTAAFLASGASLPGEFSVTLGTTMAFKGISENLVHDPGGVVYCHAHPGGGWLPGGASNVGGACLKTFFAGADLASLDQQAMSFFPTDRVCYPLVEHGERFPFRSEEAVGFFEIERDHPAFYLTLLVSVALVEKWCFERFEKLGIAVRGPIYATGSGARSDVWNQIRAHVLQIPLVRCRSTDSAFGVAVLAAAALAGQGGLRSMGKQMCAPLKTYEPDPQYRVWADEMLGRLQAGCAARSWLR
jgi:xylulokinase